MAERFALDQRTASGQGGRASAAPWSPLKERTFALIWAATVVSNIGTWMHDVAAGWLMTSLSPSPLMVALVQTATSLPMVLLALPAGALADIVDRRKLLIGVQAAMLVASAALGLVTLAGGATPALLLAFTFALGVGTALSAPAWQAAVPELVPREKLQPAIALNSLGINISRAIGPALGGFVIAGLGIAAPFLLNAASFVGIIGALALWKRDRPPAELPVERFTGAIRAGVRYARSSRPLQAALLRAAAFFVFASAYWALLPLHAREGLGLPAQGYGLLLGAVGLGAVLGALGLPRLRQRAGLDRLVLGGGLVTAAAMGLLALATEPVAAGLALFGAGAAWITVLSSLNVAAQGALPDWVRARGLAVYLTVFFAGMTGGSLLWGQAASLLGIPATLGLAAALLALASLLSWRAAPLDAAAGLDLKPSHHWSAPVLAAPVPDDRGPVLVTVEYRIDPCARARRLRRPRRRTARSRPVEAVRARLLERRQHRGDHDAAVAARDLRRGGAAAADDGPDRGGRAPQPLRQAGADSRGPRRPDRAGGAARRAGDAASRRRRRGRG